MNVTTAPKRGRIPLTDKERAAEPLSRNQERVLDFLRQFFRREGYMPTCYEVQRELHFASKNSVRRALAGLETKGRIKRVRDLARAITIIEKEDSASASHIAQRLRLDAVNLSRDIRFRHVVPTMHEAADRLDERAEA